MVRPPTHKSTTGLGSRLPLVLWLAIGFVVVGIFVLKVIGLWLEGTLLEFVEFSFSLYVVDLW